MTDEIKLLKRVSEELENAGIEYMLSGSFALNFYVQPRMTRDIDIVINLFEKDIQKFASIFEDEFYIFKEGIPDEIRRRGMFNIIEHSSGQKIDFIIRKNTEYHLTEFRRKRKVAAFGVPVYIVSPEDLIIAKLLWIQNIFSSMQLGDIKSLLELKGLDKNYIKSWITKLNLNTFDTV